MAKEPKKYDEKEAQARFEAALRGGLNTQHKPLKEKPAEAEEGGKESQTEEGLNLRPFPPWLQIGWIIAILFLVWGRILWMIRYLSPYQ